MPTTAHVYKSNPMIWLMIFFGTKFFLMRATRGSVRRSRGQNCIHDQVSILSYQFRHSSMMKEVNMFAGRRSSKRGRTGRVFGSSDEVSRLRSGTAAKPLRHLPSSCSARIPLGVTNTFCIHNRDLPKKKVINYCFEGVVITAAIFFF